MKRATLPANYLVAHALSVLLAVGWSYCSHIYNWFNVGGGKSPYMEAWISAGGVAAYLSLCAWLAALAVDVLLGRGLPRRIRALRLLATFLLTPAVFLASDWYFHLGFPPPPPM